MKLTKGQVVGILVLLAVNVFIAFVWLPYEQKCTNSHMPLGKQIAIFLSVVALALFIYNIVKQRSNMVLFFILLSLSASLIFWALCFHNLYCQGCAASG